MSAEHLSCLYTAAPPEGPCAVKEDLHAVVVADVLVRTRQKKSEIPCGGHALSKAVVSPKPCQCVLHLM